MHFYGHTHLFYDVVMAPSDAPPGIVASAISPYNYQTPNYLRVEADDKWHMLDLQQYYMAAGLSLKSVLQVVSFYASYLYSASVRLRSDDKYFRPFHQMFVGGVVTLNATGLARRIVACNTYTFTVMETLECLISP